MARTVRPRGGRALGRGAADGSPEVPMASRRSGLSPKLTYGRPRVPLTGDRPEGYHEMFEGYDLPPRLTPPPAPPPTILVVEQGSRARTLLRPTHEAGH